MFARFRKNKTRLQISLVTPRRVAGKVTQEHVGSLGSIADPASAYDRLEFWQRLHERLARLGNKMAAGDLAKVMAAVHARVPMVTTAEQRELKIKTAEEAARLAQSMHDMHADSVAGTKGLIARAAAGVSQGEAAMADLAKDAAESNERLDRLRKGEDAPAKISRPMTGAEFMKAIGWTKADLRNARVLQQLHEIGATDDAIRAAIGERHKRAVFRKVLRERLSRRAR
jgi:hypothetical protein